MIRFGRDLTNDLDAMMRREWLVTNGVGGYAMGTPTGVRTRRYHGYLISALKPPTERTLTVAALDTWVTAESSGLRENAREKYPLCTHEWAAGVLLPDGYRHLESFELDGTIPTWTWIIGNTQIVQRVWMQHGKNTTYITYEHRRGADPVTMHITPLVTYRDHHRNTGGGGSVSVQIRREEGYHDVNILPGEDLSRDADAPTPTPFRILANADTVTPTNSWWWSFRLSVETERGLNDQEDLYAAAQFSRTLRPGETLAMICTTEPDMPPPWQETLATQRERDRALVQSAQLDSAPEWIQRLALAADQFIVDRQISGDTGKSILAGYPWFTDWGRDTMIALPGLTLATHRPEIAEKVLRTFAHFVSQGMLPNRFPDAGQEPEYNTADATLWYFEAIRAYLDVVDDADLITTLYPTLREIIEWHVRGTRFGIRVDEEDGLLWAGEEGWQVTWMDVKVEDWVVTPRMGKPVEINALWYNALVIMEELAIRLGQMNDAARFRAMATRAEESFLQRFPNPEGYLYDVVDTPNGDDATLRPNQLIAVSLTNSMLDDDLARSVVDICARKLITSVGLRSLAPDEADYCAHCTGEIRSRDGAYHQGTVWSWLIGTFVAAHYRVYKDAHAAFSYLAPLGDHLRDAGLGTISEIFDGDAPHTPRGCMAQAWSVAEVLRVYRLLEPALSAETTPIRL
jgi:predicted glycogen debranching enzyme